MPASASELTVRPRREFTLNRTVAAPRALVFRAFVEPERMKVWWAPQGFRMLSCALDLREGGAWRMRIQSEVTGAVQTEIGTYREIREPDRLVFTHAWVRSNGTLTPPTVVTVTFTERDDRTDIVFSQAEFVSAESCRSHEDGWSSSLAQLTDYAPRL